MVACLSYVLQRIGDSCGSACHCQACHAALESCHAVFEHTLSGVGQSPVDVAGIAQSEAVGSVLRVVEHVTCGLIDRHGACVGSGIGLLLAHMELQSLKTIIFLAHNL